MAIKMPMLICESGKDAKELRRKMRLNQGEFWGRLRVTQSGGSRYESSRTMPDQVPLLLHLVYGTEQQASELLAYLRSPPTEA